MDALDLWTQSLGVLYAIPRYLRDERVDGHFLPARGCAVALDVIPRLRRVVPVVSEAFREVCRLWTRKYTRARPCYS